MKVIIDCSFAMSSILPDENEIKIEQLFYDIEQNKYKVLVPAIFYLECSNVLISAFVKKRIAKIDFDEYINLLNLLPINIDKFSTTSESLYAIASLSLKYNLTSYDASYLELAIRMDAMIATLDKNLILACNLANVKVY